MKKILLLFVALLTLSVTAYAQRIQVFVDGDWGYAINPFAEHEVTVVQYQGKEDSEATELTIPSYTTYNGSRYFVTVLGEGLFSKFNNVGNVEYTHEWQHETFTKLEKVTIPNTVTRIENRVFNGCISLTSVTIPTSVTRIYNNTLTGCESLQGIEVQEGNSSYKSVDGVLYNFDLTELHTYPGGKKGAFEIPNSVEKISGSAFYGCTFLTSVNIPNSVTDIGDDAFRGCSSLTSVNIPNSVINLGCHTFDGCTSLTSASIPNSVIRYGHTPDEGYVFEGCTSLTSVNIPNSAGDITPGLFKGCTSLTSVNIPNSVKKIYHDAFSGCTSLTSVTIPDAVESLGNYSFDGCTSLTTIYALPTTPPECTVRWETFPDPFRNVPKTAVVYIPKGSFKGYFVAKGWDYFTDYREMGALDITLSESSISIEEGKTATLTATVTKDDDVTIESKTWSTSNPEIATVEDGVITAIAAGTATISYTVVDGYGCPHTEYCEVTVRDSSGIEGVEVDGSDAPAEYYNLNGVRVNGEALTPGLYIKRQGGKATKVFVK